MRAEGPGFFCTTDRAGSTIAAGSRVYCTVRISNGIGKQAVIAFVRGGVEVAQTDSILITRSTHTLYAFVNAAQPGSWSCRVKVNGDTLREISFTVA